MTEIDRQSNYKNLRCGNPAWGNKAKGTGKSGNLNGGPRKEVCLTSLLKAELDKVPAGEKQGRTWRQLLVLAWLTGSMKNPTLLKELLDRVEGRVAVPVTGEGGQAIKVEILSDEDLTRIAMRGKKVIDDH